MTNKDRELITNFLLVLHLKYNLKLLGSRYFFDYVANQFNYRQKTITNYAKYSIQNIFGKSSLERYLKDSKRIEMKYVVEYFLAEHDIKYSYVFKPALNRIKLNSTLDRKKYHNTPGGLFFCLETTSLYDSSCEECLTCKFKESCINIKQRNVQSISV